MGKVWGFYAEWSQSRLVILRGARAMLRPGSLSPGPLNSSRRSRRPDLLSPATTVATRTPSTRSAPADSSSEPAPTPLTPSTSLDRALASVAARSVQFISAHRRGAVAAVVMALGGFGATAFGLAPLATDASDLPQRLVTELVTPSDMSTQLEALADHALQLVRNDLTRASDTADTLLSRLNVHDPAAAAFLRSDPVARRLLEGRAGKMVQTQVGDAGRLDGLVARFAALDPSQINSHFTRLRIDRVDGRLKAKLETAPMAAQIRMGSGSVRSSFFAATDAAGIPDGVASQLAEIFSGDIDFRRDLHAGDSFTVVYEALTADGEAITWNPASGRVMAAEFINDGQAHSAVWFKDAAGKGRYYDLAGASKQRQFLASPMEFSRVSSGFAMRMHPIMNQWRQHKGIDYSAPSGTPVRAVGEGVVDFAGWQNGYGNVVQVQHGADRATVYAHLSQVDVRKGQRVELGGRIGAVGATGWATGPHLHFEVKVGGAHQDPLSLAKTSGAQPLSAQALAQFRGLARSVKSQLDLAGSVNNAPGYAE